MLKRTARIVAAALVATTAALVPTQDAQAAVPVYSQPGDHLVNGRYWKTSCEKYSSTVVRCETKIWATKVVSHQGRYVQHNGWVFNNLTYLPSERATWKGNKLATPGEWTANGRQWKTRCDDAATGRGACRSYILSDVVKANPNGTFTPAKVWQVNNITMFSSDKVPAVTKIPAAAPALKGVPVEKPIAVAQAEASDAKVQRVLSAALGKVGSRYVHGAAGPNSFDCSGLTSSAYSQVGVSLPRSARSQYSVGTKVSRSNLKPGDLVFFYSPISHVAIYIGNGKVVHAGNPRTGVTTIEVSKMPFAGAVRVL